MLLLLPMLVLLLSTATESDLSKPLAIDCVLLIPRIATAFSVTGDSLWGMLVKIFKLFTNFN